MELESLLKKHFNYHSFKHGQKEVITSILSGSHTMAMLPTGTGKSLCYQLPAYLLEGQVLIVSPLLSLMQDQVEQLIIRGEKRVVALNSFLDKNERTQIFSRLDQYKFIFISPEMLSIDFVVHKLKQLNIALFVVDEAHCISQWGYDFRPDYMKLGTVREKLGNPLTLALTATATKEVVSDIIQSLNLEMWNEFIYSVDRPNISIRVESLESVVDKQKKLIELVSTLQGPGIIYFSSRRLAEEMVELLRGSGVQKVMAYHGGLDQESRILIQQQFLNGQLDFICATSAFGMGINKENVRFVIHYHMPLQLESYLQEIGRAGRDGKESIAILLYIAGDEQLPYQLAESELPNVKQIELCFKWILNCPDNLSNIADFEAELRILARLTDIQWRMIRDYLQSLNANELNLTKYMNEFKLFVEQRLNIKRDKINEITRWTNSIQCRREKILNYFDEQKKMDIRNCCDICGMDMQSFYKKENEAHSIDFQFHWKDYLQAMLTK
ncbi:ATP-dependent DNA helicase RecQ (plasmid) [Bacillus sp. 31A1R]|uniref:ATP-dependent DNA helicase RecQ n=1 Tax=Robertmurraya mangrovi TaxID=3098077 RepID=A0ABU5IVI6_9BACI|nr:ATP-dependent DNA helicase RecQ [Bacillus sp. 31A1R]MDZ5471168.1 ATP-dependent DNA helicase RecQ [Bacillus sp. 31A1R]